MIPHRGTEITVKNRASVFFAALCGIFFYDPTQRHGDHRENRASVFFAALCGIFFMIPHRGTEITGKNRASVFFAALCGISDCGPPLNPL